MREQVRVVGSREPVEERVMRAEAGLERYWDLRGACLARMASAAEGVDIVGRWEGKGGASGCCVDEDEWWREGVWVGRYVDEARIEWCVPKKGRYGR